MTRGVSACVALGGLHPLMAALFVLPWGDAHAAILHVPDDFPSVLEAVDAAVEADTVVVAPGEWADAETRIVYVEGFPELVTSCAFPRFGMTIRAEVPGTAVLSVEGTGTFVEVISLLEPQGTLPLIVEGLRLKSNDPEGARGIRSLRGSVVLRACLFLDNVAPAHGAAVTIGEADLVMSDCAIRSCHSEDGVVSVVAGGLQMERCTFEQCSGKCIQVDQEVLDGQLAGVSMNSCVFVGNRGAGLGTALDVTYLTYLDITNCVFRDNVALDRPGGAVRLSACDDVTIEYNVFDRDSVLAAASPGGGVRWDGSRGTVRHNTFVGCHATLGGAAFTAGAGGRVAFDRNVVSYSTGGAAVHASGTAVVSNACNLYWANESGDFRTWTLSGSEIFADPKFCDIATSDFTVREDSPCAVGACAPIGALGIGCDDIAIEPLSWSRLKAWYRVPE